MRYWFTSTCHEWFEYLKEWKKELQSPANIVVMKTEVNKYRE